MSKVKSNVKKSNKNKVKRIKNNKGNYVSLLLLLVLFLGIGYAILTEQLTIKNTVSYNAMKWNFGFTTVVDPTSLDYDWPDNYIFADITISEDRKSIDVSCDVGGKTEQLVCVGMIEVVNDSTFDVELDYVELVSDIDYTVREEYVTTNYYFDGMDPEDHIYPGDIIEAGDSKVLFSVLRLSELTEEMLPEGGMQLDFRFDTEWLQVEN